MFCRPTGVVATRIGETALGSTWVSAIRNGPAPIALAPSNKVAAPDAQGRTCAPASATPGQPEQGHDGGDLATGSPALRRRRPGAKPSFAGSSAATTIRNWQAGAGAITASVRRISTASVRPPAKGREDHARCPYPAASPQRRARYAAAPRAATSPTVQRHLGRHGAAAPHIPIKTSGTGRARSSSVPSQCGRRGLFSLRAGQQVHPHRRPPGR